MGLSFGFGGGSSKNSFNGTDTFNTTTNTNQTTAPTNPDWVNYGGQSLWSGAQQLGAANPQSYVAGPNALQTQAGTAAGQSSLTDPGGYGAAGSYAQNLALNGVAPQTTGVQASPYIQQNMNPYIDNVVNATMADFDANAGQTRAQQALEMARGGAFGGSGAAITQSLTEGQLARARATQDAGLRSQGFDTALGAAQQDANRQQGANDLNAQLHGQMQDRRLAANNQIIDATNAYTNNARSNIATQSGVGDALRKVSQQQASAPLDLQSWLTSQFSGLPLNLYNGQTQTGTQDQSGTENQSGTSKGKTSSFNFGLKPG